MVKIDERFNIKKNKEDVCIVKISIYNYCIKKDYDTSNMYIRDGSGSTIKILNALWYDEDSVYFQFTDEIEIGDYFFDISLNTEIESLDIIHDRRLSIC